MVRPAESGLYVHNLEFNSGTRPVPSTLTVKRSTPLRLANVSDSWEVRGRVRTTLIGLIQQGALTNVRRILNWSDRQANR
jgi:hypothetical protein